MLRTSRCARRWPGKQRGAARVRTAKLCSCSGEILLAHVNLKMQQVLVCSVLTAVPSVAVAKADEDRMRVRVWEMHGALLRSNARNALCFR